MRKFVYLLAAFLIVACCPCKHVVRESSTVEQDSMKTEVRREVVYVPDTVLVEIPAQMAERTTRDSTSHLENDYAVSDVRINPDGSLHHTLETKPQKKPVEFQKPVERNDSIVYKYKYFDGEVVKVKELSRWDQFKVDYGGWAITLFSLLAGFGIWRVVRKFV
ncbi:MAG: hypothetical protein IJM04_04400 [Prevotella sp.]|nr:hypothetical protein [Prevotella sp.]